MDIQDLLRQPSPVPSRPPYALGEKADVPQSLGILSKTVFRSPIVRWILPAIIRGGPIPHNDVIFVGDNFIELKEIFFTGYVRHRALKTDFGCGIRSAQILGHRPLPNSIKPEEDRNGTCSHVKDVTIDDTTRLPPQILVLALKTSEIVFVTASADSSKPTTFNTYSHPLPIFEGSFMHQPGNLTAIDPESRAIAVAAVENNIVLVKVRPIAEHNSLEDLLDDMIVYGADMTILRMEFLYPSLGDSSQVYLLVVGNEGIQIVSWDHGQALTSDNITTKRARFAPENRVPTLVIPLKEPGSFMMVAESGLSIFCDAHIGSLRMSYWHPRTPDDDPPQYPGLTSRFPLWTCWARPVRGNHYFHDDLYLAREDGVIWWLRIIQSGGQLSISDLTTAGILNSTIGNAFACMATDLTMQSPDVLLTGGDVCHGGSYMLGRENLFGQKNGQTRTEVMTPDIRHVSSNWAPFTDLAIVDVAPIPWKQGGAESRQRPRVYATSGKAPNGAVSELRYGLQLAVASTIASEDLANASRIWPLERMDCVVLSFPEHSAVLYGGESHELQTVTISDESTLAVAVLKSSSGTDEIHSDNIESILHVTSSSMQVFRLDPTKPAPQHDFQWETPGITIAAIEPLDYLVISVHRVAQRSLVQLRRLVVSDDQWEISVVGLPIEFDDEPSCINVFRGGRWQRASASAIRRGANYVILGTEAGSFHLLRADTEHGLVRLFSHILTPTATNGLRAACESVSVMVNPKSVFDGSENMFLALCGMRDGILYAIDLRYNDSDGAFGVANCKAFVIGDTPIRAVPDVDNSSCAMIHCDTQILYLYAHEFMVDRIRFESVWFTEATNRTLSNSPILDICQIPMFSMTEGAYSRLACITRTALLVGKLDDNAQPLPRALAVRGTPSRTIYLSEHRLLVVASTVIMTATTPTPKRFPLLAVTLIRPSETNQADLVFEQDPPQQAEPHYIGAPGERLCGLTEWCCTRAGTRYQFVVISTSNVPKPGHRPTGNLIFLQILPGTSASGIFGVRADQVKSEEAPVRALCQFGTDALVYCCGSEIRMRTFLFEERRFERKTLTTLNSPGIYITAQAPFIYVTTTEHSVRAFKFENQVLEPVIADSVAREGLAHLNLPKQHLLLLTDKHGSVAAIQLPNNSNKPPTPRTVFEAKLPHSITRLCNVAIRPPWKATQVPGILERDLLGTATDGSLTSLSILTPASWRLLRFTQNMCMRSARICEFTPWAYEEDMHLEPRGKVPTDFHVDGDILGRLVEGEDSARVLNDMLDVIPCDGSEYGSRVDYDTADRRRSRFKELVDAVFKESPVDQGNAVQLERSSFGARNEDPVEMALSYMRAALDSPF